MSEQYKVDVLIDVKARIDEAKEQFNDLLQQEDQQNENSNVRAALNEDVQRAQAAIEYLEGMVNKIGSKDIGGRMVQEVMEGLKDIGSMGKLLQKGNNDFGLIGVNMAKSIFRNFEPEVQKQLNAMTPMMMNAIRTSFKRQSNTSSFAQMAAEMMSKASNADWINTLNRNGVANKDIQKHLELLMAPALSLSRTAGYRSDRYGAISADRIRSTQEFLPVGLRGAWQNGTGYQRGEWIDRTDQSKQHMTAKAQRTLGDLISSNPAAWRAAERAGLLQHNGGKSYSLARNISPKLYDEFVSNIYDDFVRRAEGSPARHIGFYDQGLDEDTQIRLNNRMTSGTAGKAMDALWAAMDLRHVSSFGKSEPRKQVSLANVPKRNLNQYETNKYTLADVMSGKFTNPQKVSINESTFTRVLEQIRGENIEHNSDISDAMIEVALGQYDENNADQSAYLKRIMKEGLKVGNQRYDLVNIHGTGFDTTGRFVRRSDREKIQNYYAEQVKNLGLSGDDVFRMFVDRNRKFKDFKEYSRYLDATGKIFSPGAQGIDLGNYKYKDAKGNTQTGANFAFVKFMEDEEKLADGQAWVIDDLIPHEGEQSRFALAGKGMVHSLHGAKNIAEYARNAGILEEIMKRTGLSEAELENVHGLIDESSVKNLQAYENLKTPQERNRALTAQTRLFGFSEMKSAESRTSDAEGLGRQVMQFLEVDPETLIKNAAAAANKIRFLQTDIGARSLINGSRNDVERERLRTKGHEATSQEAQRMVDNEIASIIRRYSSGEWIEMDPDESSVRNMVLNESLVGAALLSGDKSPESIRKRLLGSAKIQANKDQVKQIQEMTNEEQEGIFALNPGQGLDFTTNAKGEYENSLSILRNPTGAGQLIGEIKNYAKQAKPIYDALGIPTVGAFLNLKDMKTLGDADFDGDTIKAIYGHLSDIMKASAEKQEAMRKQLGDFETPQLVGAGFSAKGPFAHSSGTWQNYLSQAIKTGGFMGQQDTAAARAAALGLNDYQNMQIAFQASEGYAQATNALKEYKNVQKTKEEEEITGVGRPWVRYGGAFTTFLNTTGRDNQPIPSQENIYTSPKGIKINLDAMRAARLESMMAPSIHETSNLIAPQLASKLPGFAIDTSYADAVVSAFKYLHENEDKQTPALAPAHEVRDMYQKMLAYRMVGAQRFLSSEDETLFSDKALEAGRAISKYTQDVLAGNVMHPGATVENGNIQLGGTKYSASSFENQLLRQNSIPQILGMINETGQTERNLERVYPGLLKDQKNPELFKSVFSNVGEYSFADTARASEQLKNVVGHSAAVNIAQQALMERIARPVSTLGRASSSVTSVEPWFVDQEGNSITLRGVQYSRGNDPQESVKDAPLYATREKMMSARAQKEASLIRKIIEDPEKPNADIEQGNLMHGVLEYAFNTQNNNQNADIKPSEILRSLLQGNNNNGTYMPTSKMAEALQVLKSEQYGVIDKDGNIMDDGPAAGAKAAIKLSALQGNEENKGAIDRFFEHVRSRGKNSEYITEYAFDYIDNKIKEATRGYNDTSKPYAPYGQQRGTVRPDQIQIDKDSGDVTLYDYKSSIGDAWKSIAQMSSYATMMNNMAKQYYAYEGRIKAGTFSKDDEDEWAYYESLKKKGAQRWGYYDDKGEYHSRIKRLIGANVPGGTERYELDLSTKAGQEFAESVQESYIEGIKQRADEASKGDREGRQKVLREYRKNIGVNEGSVMADALTDLIINESAKEMVERARQSGEEIGLSPVLTQHAERDAETLAQIRSQLFKKQRQMGLMPETGFSQYTMMRNQIENEMMTEDQLTQMKAYYLSKNDMLSVEEMDKRQKEMRETRNWLNEMERKGVPSDLEYATKMAWKTAAEAKPGNTYDALSALDYRQKNAQAQVSGLQRPEFFSEGKWKNSEEAQEQKRAWEIANIEYENLKKQDAEARNYIKQKQEYNQENIKRRGNEIDFEQYMYQNQYGLNRLRESPRFPFIQNSLIVRNYENRLQQQIQRDQREYQLSREIHKSYDSIRAEHELQMDLQSRIGKDTTKEQEDAINKDIKASQDRIELFNKSIGYAKENLAQLKKDDKSDFGNALAAGFDTATQSVERLVSRLGRQALQKALTEAKQFVIQFSTEMSQIQAITMMSDEQMQGERAKNISQAKSLHTSISNVAETRASLYRQGLSESEVDDRTEAIIKFATVTGTKVTNATKYLTTAIQNGLVDSVEGAMDVLVALGDSAATTAEEISKGMQKSAAAAANAGVSFEELSTMLTITTSRTQLGGNVAGTAMQTLLSRMTRVTNGQALVDTSGEVISANKVEEALKSVGINMRETNNPQSFKDPYQILLQLSKVWNNLNDMQKGNISYAMAGGRQVNMFQTLMEGFAEDNGAELERLMGLAEDSEGITDDKYALAINNINTALTDLKNTFDGIVQDLTSNGFITGAQDWVNNIVTGLGNITHALGPLGTGLTALGVIVAGFAAKMWVAAAAKETLTKGIGALLTLTAAAGITSILVGGWGAGTNYNKQQERQSQEYRKENIKGIEGQIESHEKTLSAVDKSRKILDSWKNDSIDADAAINKQDESLTGLKDTSVELQQAFANKDIQMFENALKGIENMSDAAKKKLIELKQEIIDVDLEGEIKGYANDLADINESKQIGTSAVPEEYISNIIAPSLKGVIKANIASAERSGFKESGIEAALTETLLAASENGYAEQEIEDLWQEYVDYYTKNASEEEKKAFDPTKYTSFRDAYDTQETEQKTKKKEFPSFENWVAENYEELVEPIYEDYMKDVGERPTFDVGTAPTAMSVERIPAENFMDPNKVPTATGFMQYQIGLRRSFDVPSMMSYLGSVKGKDLKSLLQNNANYRGFITNGDWDAYEDLLGYKEAYAAAQVKSDENFNAQTEAANSQLKKERLKYEQRIRDAQEELNAWEEKYSNGEDSYVAAYGDYENQLAERRTAYQAAVNKAQEEYDNAIAAMGNQFTSFVENETGVSIKDLYEDVQGNNALEKTTAVLGRLKFAGGDSYDRFMTGFTSFWKSVVGDGKYATLAKKGFTPANANWLEVGKNISENELNQLLEDYFNGDYDSQISEEIYGPQFKSKAKQIAEKYVGERYFNLTEGQRNQLIADQTTEIENNPVTYSDENTIMGLLKEFTEARIQQGINVDKKNEPYYYYENGEYVGVSEEGLAKLTETQKRKQMYKDTETKKYKTFTDAAETAYAALEFSNKKIQQTDWNKLNNMINGITELGDFGDKLMDQSGLEGFENMLNIDSNLAVLYEQAIKGGETELKTFQDYVQKQALGGRADEVLGKAMKERTELSIDKGIIDRMEKGTMTNADMAKIASAYGVDFAQYQEMSSMYNAMYKSGYGKRVTANTQDQIDYAKNNGYFTEEAGWNEAATDQVELAYQKEMLKPQFRDLNAETGEKPKLQYYLEGRDITPTSKKGTFAMESTLFTNTMLRDAARLAFNAGNVTQANAQFAKEYGDQAEEYMEQVKSQYPELYKWLNMDSEQRTTLEGQNIERSINIKFNLENVEELTQAGVILEGYADAQNTINEASAEKREKGKYAGIGTASGYNEAMQAMSRIMNGKANIQDWETVGGYLGVDSATLAMYQAGTLGKEELNASLTAMSSEAARGVQEIMQSRALKAYNEQNGTSFKNVNEAISYDYIDEETGTPQGARRLDWINYVKNNGWMDDYNKLGYYMDEKTGEVYYDATQAAQVSALDRYNAAKNIRASTGLSTNYTNAYKSAYTLANNGYGAEDIVRILGEELPQEFRDQLIEAEEAVAKGDANAVKRLAYNTAYGGGYGAGMYNINNDEVQSVLSTLLSGGNVNDLLANKPELSSYMSNLLPNQEEYKNVLAQNKELTEAQKNDIKQIEATQKAVEKERTGEYQAGTSQSVSAMFGLDEAARRQAIQSYASEYYAMTDAERALNKFETDRTNKEARSKLAQFLNVDEAAVRDMDNEKLDEAFDKRKQEVQDKFMDFIKGSFQMDNITNLNDQKAGIDALNGEAKESAQAMYDSIMFFMNMMHMAVDESGQIISEDTFDQKEYTEDLSGRNTRQQAQADQLQLYKDVQAGKEVSLTEEQVKSISPLLSTQAAKNAIDKIADGEELTKTDVAAIRDSSDFQNAISPDDQYQIANRFFNSIFGTAAVERMAAGKYTPTEDQLQDEELFNNPDQLNVLSLYGKEGSAFSEAFSTYQKDRSKENLDALTRAYIDLGSQMDKTANIEKNKLGKSTEYVETQLKKLRGTTKEVIEAEKEFNAAMTQVNDNQYYRDQWKKGDRGSKTLASIQQQTGIDTQQQSKGTYNKTILDNMLNLQETEDKQVIQDWVNIKAKEILQSFQDEINNLSDEEKIELEGIDIEIKEGQFSASGLENVSENVASVISNIVSQQNATFNGIKFQGMLDGQWDGDVFTLLAKTINSITSTMPHGGGGGGGGGGKTATDKLIDKLKNRVSGVDHQIKMVQYAETRYQNRGELTNYMNALRTEDIYQADKQNVLEDNIKQMKAHMATLKKDTDEWRKAYEALKGYEEQLAQVINTREDLDKKIKDTKKQILQTTIDLQDRLAELLEAEETKRRNMLAGTVSMEQTILDTIRNRYQEEWELVERDLDKKRDALQEEMALIDERLQRRKDAEDEAEKYEELAEYQRQLAFVSMDPTRSKDAAELRQKIADLQKDISWDLADKQAQAAKDDLQDQMDAYDKFKTRGQEDLQAFLEDANNMAEELKKIMSGSKDDIIAWLKANNVEYKNATDNARKQMIDSWTDTYNDMAGITITYWKQVKQIMAGDLKGAIDQLKNSDQYKNATTQMQQKMVGDLTDIWDNWRKANLNSKNDDTHNDDDVTKGGKTKTNTNPGTNTGKNPVNGNDVSTIKDAVTKFRGDFQKLDNNTQKMLQVISARQTDQGKNVSNLFDLFKNSNIQISKPGKITTNQVQLSETSLENKDIKLMRSMLDSMSKVRVPSLWAYLDPDKFSDASQTIGTVNIEINEASFADDADLDEVAREVGRRFTQELERNGMNVTNYSF